MSEEGEIEMMNLKHALKYPAIAAISCAVLSSEGFSQSNNPVSTTPVGFIKLDVTAGSGTTKRLTYLSIPLVERATGITGQSAGQITGVTSNTISNTNAGWVAGALSNPAEPHVIQITSGTAEGRIFLISANSNTGGAIGGPGLGNTTTTLTISSFDSQTGIDLVAAGVAAGDSYTIFTCETISSVFGTPATTGVLGGTAVSSSDSVVMLFNGSSSSFFYHTGNSRWTRSIAGNPDASNVPLMPYYGLIYSRLPASGLSFTVTGSVPTTARKMQIKNSGVTLLAQFWPTESTLASLNLQSLPGWAANTSASLADKVILVSAGSSSTYWYNGTNWLRQIAGNPISDTTTIPAGSTIYINKLGSTSGYSTLEQPLPYNLNL